MNWKVTMYSQGLINSENKNDESPNFLKAFQVELMQKRK